MSFGLVLCEIQASEVSVSVLKSISFESDIFLWSSSIGLKFWADIEDILDNCRYSLGQLQHGLLPSWKHHPLSYKISTPLWRNLKQCLGTMTRPGLQPTTCIASSKGHVWPSSTPQNSGNLPATSIREKLPWLISFAMGFVMMFKIFCWHSQTLLPSVKLSPRQFGAIIVCSNVARKKKSPPTPSFGTVGLLRSPQFLKQHQLPELPLLDLLRCRSTQLSLNLW